MLAPAPLVMEFRLSDRLGVHTSRQSLDLINLELDRAMILARFCQEKRNSASAEDLRKAKAFYERALEMFNRHTHLTVRQKRALDRKLRRLEQSIRTIEMAPSPAKLGSSGPLPFPAASLLNHKS